MKKLLFLLLFLLPSLCLAEFRVVNDTGAVFCNINNTTSMVTFTNVFGGGVGLDTLNATNLSTGTVPDARITWKPNQAVNTTSTPTFAGLSLGTSDISSIGNILPAADSTYALGDSTPKYFLAGYFDALTLNPSASWSGATAGVLAGTGALSCSLDFGLNSLKKIYLDGVARTGDTYIFESGANVFDLYVGGVNTIKSTTTLVTISTASLQVTNYLYGSAAANGDLQLEATSSATKTTANILMNAAGGNVSIGADASPDYLLDVDGTFGTSGSATIEGELLAGSIHSFSFPLPGALSTGTNMMGTQIIIPFACTLVKAYINAGVAPTGASIIFDANYDSNGGADAGGTSIWASGANRPNIAISTFTNSTTTFNTTALAAGGTLTVDLDQVGSTIAGSNACLTLICRKTGTY